MDQAQKNIIDTLDTIADNRHKQDKLSKSLQWQAFLDVFFNQILNESVNQVAKFNQAFLREGEEVYLTNEDIIGMLEVNYPELAVAYKSMIEIDQDDQNSVYNILEQEVKKSIYAKVLKKRGYTLLLHIHDEPIEWMGTDEDGNYYSERYIDGIGLQLFFNNNELKEMDNGINEKTDEYQYVTYSDD